jgi:two-component SAPR family response regulator
MKKNKIFFISLSFLLLSILNISAKELSETSFLIATVTPYHLGNQPFWDYIQSDRNTGIETSLTENEGKIYLANSQQDVNQLIVKLQQVITSDSLKLFPVFINYEGKVAVLDSVISNSEISPFIFFLPRGEAWPSAEYLIQSGRRIIFFVNGEVHLQQRMLHPSADYIMELSASGTSGLTPKTNLELLMIRNFDKLPVAKTSGSNIRNLVPDYINFLLETWTKYGKRPNFIFINTELLNFNFIISQLNSFTWIKGTVKSSGKTFEKVYWKNPDIIITGGRFSLPYRGGEELTLTPFIPGYRLTPEHIIVTGEMEVPETYSILAAPFNSGEGLTGSFTFEQSIMNLISPQTEYNGTNYSFVQDIERGTVLRLPENSSVTLKSPEIYGMRNSSFTVSCFVKFSEILEFGDNAVLGNYESEYRRGLHLILRSGHPYFGLWANDYISEEKLEPNVWYHLVWRYIIETGEQAIFLNGRNIGSSAGHPPFSGTGDIHLGSALSQGASMRGYIDELHFWNRPLGSEEINRLALNEPVIINNQVIEDGIFKQNKSVILAGIIAFLILIAMYFIFFRRRNTVVAKTFTPAPINSDKNQISIFGGFRAIDKEGNDISELFTPKVRELLLFVLLYSLKNGSGASVTEIDEQLWPGLEPKKVTNNRAVTLNKLRKLLQQTDGLNILTRNGTLLAEIKKPFCCDYVEAYNLCHLPGGMDKKQLERFFNLTKNGKLLKGISWPWLDEMRGYTGNQIIDNLLKLSVIYKEEKKLTEIETISKGILDYDELNEEAVWLHIWCLRQKNNMHQAKFYFENFRTRYSESMAEKYPFTFEQFNNRFSNLLMDFLEQ